MKKLLSVLMVLIMGAMLLFTGCTKGMDQTGIGSRMTEDVPTADIETLELLPEFTKEDLESAYDTEIVEYDQSMQETENIIIQGSRSTSLAEDKVTAYQGEEYGYFTEKGFQDTLSQPLSTFAVDVDTASYANMRRYINSGIIPPSESIRIEEMLNYFTYDYEEPKDEIPFSVNTQLGQCPWNEDNYLMSVGILGTPVEKEDLPKSNLIFLIDISGSMDSPDKLPLLKNAFGKLVEELDEDDRVSIVVYASGTGIVLDGVHGEDQKTILKALESLEAGGGTGGASGIELAYQLAKKNYREHGNNRVILATDGDFNIGLSSLEELEELIEDKRRDGIYLSVMGFGTGNLKDNRMELLANKGNGNYYYIDTEKEAKKVLVDEMAGTILTIAKDVKVQIEFNPLSVREYRLIGYDNRLLKAEDFRDDKVDAGEIGAGHSVTALYEIVPAVTFEGSQPALKYQSTPEMNQEYQDEVAQITLRYQETGVKFVDEMVRIISFSNTPVNHVNGDFQFMAAIAEFAMILKNSEYVGDGSLEKAITLGKQGMGEDKQGYRKEFIELIEQYQEIISR